VLVTNDFLAESVRNLNPRVLPHNNAIPDDFLPKILPERPPIGHHPNEGPVRIGYVGSGYRIDEFRLLWDALVQLSQQYQDKLIFEFWGLDVSSLPELSSPVAQKPFTFSYLHYINALEAAGFDILLSPLLDHPKPRLAKSLIKYYETAVAGALGIFSDVPQYQALLNGITCLKAANNSKSWYEVISQAIEMRRTNDKEYDLLRQRCLEHVREEFTVSGQIDLHEAALRALEFHANTRANRNSNGKPRLMYVLHSAHYGGAEIQLWRRLHLARRYGIEPIVVIPSVLKDTEDGLRLKTSLDKEHIQLETVEYTCFTEPRSPEEFFSDLERNQIRELLVRCEPALVHSVTFIPSFGQICQEMKIPHVNTLYAVQDDFTWEHGGPDFEHCDIVQSDCIRYAKRWGELLDTQKICARDMATEELFKLGQLKYLESIGQTPATNPCPHLIVTGTFQQRKQQLETILALGRLKNEGFDFRLSFYGYSHFFPDYLAQCKQAIEDWDLQEQVNIEPFTPNIDQVLAQADFLLSLSTYESFPGSIKDALAAGVPVVTTPVGGVSELIIDNVSGILCSGITIDELVNGIRRALELPASKKALITEQGRRIARLELHPYRAANDLFRMYNHAISNKQQARAIGTAIRQITPSQVDPTPHHHLSVKSGIKTSGKALEPTAPSASLMQLGAGLNYHFTPRASNWSGLGLLAGVHEGPRVGNLRLQILTPSGYPIRTSSIPLNKIQPNEWFQMRFNPIQNSAGRHFTIALSLEEAADTTLSFYQSSERPIHQRVLHKALRDLGAKLRGGQLYCRELYSLS
jgi:glycosyltransferase involved in cell wall biosynthesis